MSRSSVLELQLKKGPAARMPPPGRAADRPAGAGDFLYLQVCAVVDESAAAEGDGLLEGAAKVGAGGGDGFE